MSNIQDAPTGYASLGARALYMDDDGLQRIRPPAPRADIANLTLAKPDIATSYSFDQVAMSASEHGGLSIDVAAFASYLGFGSSSDSGEAPDYGRLSIRADDGVDPPITLQEFTDPDRVDEVRLAAFPSRAGVVETSDIGFGRTRAEYGADADRVTLGFDAPTASHSAGGLQVAVEPSARMILGDRVSGAGVGALVRLGENMASPRAARDIPGWYVYAGADAQAFTWKLDSDMTVEEAVRFEDRLMVGDAEVGVGWRAGLAEVALGFVHREVHYEEFETTEQFGGVTVVVNR